MNPMKLIQIKNLVDRFKQNHTKIPGYLNAVAKMADEGSVIEMKVTNSSGKVLQANIRVNADDMELLREIDQLDVPTAADIKGLEK